MDRSFDFILAGIALIVGIMLLTGHGDIFLKGGNTTSLTAKFIYILAILAILVGFVVYLKKKCIKK